MLGYHNHFISTAHTEEDLLGVQETVKKAFTALSNSAEVKAESMR